MLAGEGRSGVVLQILMLLNFMNIAKRQSVSASPKRVMYRQHAIVIGRKKSPVECSVVIVRCTVAHCCENIASLIKKLIY